MKIHKQKSFKYASVDLETTGLNPIDCHIIQFAIILDDMESPIEELPRLTLYVLQRDDWYFGESYALHMNSRHMYNIAMIAKAVKDGVADFNAFCYEEELAERVALWLKDNGWDGDKITFAGKNFATFDKRFLDEIEFFDTVPMRHRVIDPGSMLWSPGTDGGVLPDTKTICERLGIDSEVKHDALADALQVVQIIRAATGDWPEETVTITNEIADAVLMDTPLDGPRIFDISTGNRI